MLKSRIKFCFLQLKALDESPFRLQLHKLMIKNNNNLTQPWLNYLYYGTTIPTLWWANKTICMYITFTGSNLELLQLPISHLLHCSTANMNTNTRCTEGVWYYTSSNSHYPRIDPYSRKLQKVIIIHIYASEFRSTSGWGRPLVGVGGLWIFSSCSAI